MNAQVCHLLPLVRAKERGPVAGILVHGQNAARLAGLDKGIAMSNAPVASTRIACLLMKDQLSGRTVPLLRVAAGKQAPGPYVNVVTIASTAL
jgi:hypothetical protein